MTKLSLITFILFLFTLTMSAQSNPESPTLDFICELKVLLEPPYVVGETPYGLRRIIPIVGGTVTGPGIKGEILDGGADWQVVREDGVAELEAHYQFRTDDGVIVYIKNTGLRVATPEVAARIGKGEDVPASEYYFRAIPKFEAPAGKYEWMNNAIFICKGIKNPDHVLIQVWKVK